MFNKQGKIYKHTNLDEILTLDISKSLKKTFKTMFNKKVYFEHEGKCKIGKLVGLEVNEQLCNYYFIISIEDKFLYITTNKSLTLL